jgi:hypothetical protein
MLSGKKTQEKITKLSMVTNGPIQRLGLAKIYQKIHHLISIRPYMQNNIWATITSNNYSKKPHHNTLNLNEEKQINNLAQQLPIFI